MGEWFTQVFFQPFSSLFDISSYEISVKWTLPTSTEIWTQFTNSIFCTNNQYPT